MAIKRVDRFHDPVFAIIMPNDDDVAPAEMNVPREDDYAVANAVDRIVEIAIAATDAIPILARMLVRTKAARLVITSPVRVPDWEIETVRQLAMRYRVRVAFKCHLRLDAANEGRDQGAS